MTTNSRRPVELPPKPCIPNSCKASQTADSEPVRPAGIDIEAVLRERKMENWRQASAGIDFSKPTPGELGDYPWNRKRVNA